MVDKLKGRSSASLVLDHQAWGNYQEHVHLSPFASEQVLIDQVNLGSPLGLALCEAVRKGYTVRRDIMGGPPQKADELNAVIKWQLEKERRELDEATTPVALDGVARRL